MRIGQASIIVVICFLVYLPFLNKGLSCDDLVFLDYAKLLTKNPVQCTVTDYLFLGHELKDMIVFESTHPPFVPYVLKTVLFLFGEKLPMLHLAMFIFLAIGSLSLGDLFARFTKAGPFPALAVTLGPLFLANATSLMTDSTLFAMWFGAMAAWDRALCSDKPFSLWHGLTILATTAAFFTAYQALGLLVVLPLMAVLRGRFLSTGWVLLALILFVLWLVLVYKNYGIVPYFSSPRDSVSIANEVHKGLVWENIFNKSRALVYYLGAAGFAFWPVIAWRKGRIWLYVAALGWGWMISAYIFPQWGFSKSLYPAFLAGFGLLALVPLVKAVFDAVGSDRELRYLGLISLVCVGGFTVFQVFLASFAAPRYNLITVAALFLVGMRQVEVGALWRIVGTAMTVALGLLVALGERDYANAQRIDRLDVPDVPLYYVGEKGVQYAGDRAGYYYFLPKMMPDVHYLLMPQEIDAIAVPSELLEKAELVAEYPIHSNWPVRVMNREAGAGFYIHGRGMLPFVFGSGLIDTFKLYRVYPPGHPLWTEGGSDTRPVGEILQGVNITEDFTCQSDGLTRFRLLMATYGRSNASTLEVSLVEIDDLGNDGAAVFTESVDARDLADNDWYEASFKPVASKGKRYRLRLTSPDAIPETAATVWYNARQERTWQKNGETQKGALGFETFCAPGMSAK